MVLSPSVCGHLLRPPKDTDSGVVISGTVPRGRRTCPRGLPFVLSPQSSPDSSRPSAVIKSTGSGHEPRGGQDLGHLLPPRCPAALRGAQPLLAGRWAPRPFSARSLSRWAPAPLDPWSQTIQAIRPLGSRGGGVATRPCHPACPGLGRGKNGAFVSLANIDRAAPGCWARPRGAPHPVTSSHLPRRRRESPNLPNHCSCRKRLSAYGLGRMSGPCSTS